MPDCPRLKAVPILYTRRYDLIMNIILPIMVLAALGLLLGAFALWRKGGPKKQVFMMVFLAAIAIVNVAIWTVPDAEGQAPLDRLNQVENTGSQGDG